MTPGTEDGTLHILIIDDNAQFLAAASSLLAVDDRVAAVTVAVDRVEAMAALSADPALNLILIDVNLGPHDGLDLCRELTRRWPARPKVLVSSMAELDLPASPESYGAVGFIGKRRLDAAHLVRLLARTPHDRDGAASPSTRNELG